jgi:hypothetical protein
MPPLGRGNARPDRRIESTRQQHLGGGSGGTTTRNQEESLCRHQPDLDQAVGALVIRFHPGRPSAGLRLDREPPVARPVVERPYPCDEPVEKLITALAVSSTT